MHRIGGLNLIASRSSGSISFYCLCMVKKVLVGHMRDKYDSPMKMYTEVSLLSWVIDFIPRKMAIGYSST